MTKDQTMKRGFRCTRSWPALALLALAATAQAQEGAPQPRYDATGEWIFYVEAPRLLVGDCPVDDEAGYAQRVAIHQTGSDFTIAIEGGAQEQGTVDGDVYTHTSTDTGVDITGLPFTLNTYTSFTLISADAAVGTTTLDLQFGDATRCQLDLRFEGERRAQTESITDDPVRLRPA